VARKTRLLLITSTKSFEINSPNLALGLHFESPVTRAAKISGATAILLLVCSLAAILRPRFSRQLVHQLARWHSDRLQTALVSDLSSVLPNVTFWAWERPEDLRFLSDQKAGVAFLATTLYLETPQDNTTSRPSLLVRPRFQPLRVGPRTFLTAVVRIETPRSLPPSAFFKNISSEKPSSQPQVDDERPLSLDPQTSAILHRAANEISTLQNLPGVRAIQIDFDATVSQRSFYSALLSAVHRQLRPSMPLSITALASWCIGDPWLANLPPGTINEAVPMLFRLGPDAADVIAFLHSGNEFPVAACRASLGLSADEPLSQKLLTNRFSGASPALRRKRIYIFSPRAQTQSAAQFVIEEWHP
jgi:hypothetical protein